MKFQFTLAKLLVTVAVLFVTVAVLFVTVVPSFIAIPIIFSGIYYILEPEDPTVYFSCFVFWTFAIGATITAFVIAFGWVETIFLAINLSGVFAAVLSFFLERRLSRN